MPVTEHEVVDERVVLQVLLRINHKTFLILSFVWFCLAVFHPAAFGPVVAERDEPPWVDAPCQLSQCVALKALEHETGLPIVVYLVEFVTMGEVEFLAADFHGAGIPVHDHTAFFLQIVAAPHVVVSLKEVNLHATVGQLADFSQQPGVAFRNDIPVFKPEVEDVAKHENSLRLVLYGIKEVDETAFLRAPVFKRAASQVGVGYEIVVLHRVV